MLLEEEFERSFCSKLARMLSRRLIRDNKIDNFKGFCLPRSKTKTKLGTAQVGGARKTQCT